MLSRQAASSQLVREVAFALQALSKHLAVPDDNQLEKLELAFNEMLIIHREVVADVKSSKKRKVYSPSQAGRMFRVMVVFTSILDLVANQLKTKDGQPWGAHLFSTQDFSQVGYDSFTAPTDRAAIGKMISHQGTDMIEAASDAQRLSVSAGVYSAAGTIEAAVESICAHFSTTRVPALPIDLWDEARVLVELHVTQPDLQKLEASRNIIVVPTWTGEAMYPVFQFGAGAILPTIRYLLANADPTLQGWPLAVFAFEHRTENRGFFEQTLAARGKWKPNWRKAATNQFKGVKGRPAHTIRAGAKLYRIARSGYSPFFFASVGKRAPAATSPGRFDLNDPRGTVYMAESSKGAWREVLDREPVVTLRSLLGRTVWEMTPKSDIEVGDATLGGVELSASTIRNDTRQLAERFAMDFSGIRYSLRSTVAHIGYAFFGPMGPTLPHRAALGLWNSTEHDGLADAGLWEYLDEREKSLPVVLRRFPEEIVAKSP